MTNQCMVTSAWSKQSKWAWKFDRMRGLTIRCVVQCLFCFKIILEPLFNEFKMCLFYASNQRVCFLARIISRNGECNRQNRKTCIIINTHNIFYLFLYTVESTRWTIKIELFFIFLFYFKLYYIWKETVTSMVISSWKGRKESQTFRRRISSGKESNPQPYDSKTGALPSGQLG